MPKTTKKPAAPKRGIGLKLIRLELSDAAHRDFRVEAAKEGLPMAIMARRLVEEWITKRKGAAK